MPPYVDTLKELAKPISMVNKEVYLDGDTTSCLKGSTKGKHACKQILSCSFGCKPYFGLCDPGSPVNIIPYTLYANKIMKKFLHVFLSQLIVLLILEIKLVENHVASWGTTMTSS